MLLVLCISVFGRNNLYPVHAQAAPTNTHVLSDGQFVYGPNIGSFDLKTYLRVTAPHLMMYADDLYSRSEYFSINPKVYLNFIGSSQGFGFQSFY